MSRLCDPDINMICLPGCTTPEPSIRYMIYHYYDSHGMGSEQSKLFTDQYLSEQDDICCAALDAMLAKAREVRCERRRISFASWATWAEWKLSSPSSPRTQPMTDREKVARAIFDASTFYGEWDRQPKANQEVCYNMADAAIAALEPSGVKEAARDEALTALDQLEAVEDAYTRWMLANAVGDPDLVHRDGNKLSKALFAMLNDGPEDGPPTILRALRALAERGE